MSITRTKLSADDPAQLLASEEPQYTSLAQAVGRSWQMTKSAFADLREEWWEIVGLTQPEKTNARKDALSGAARRALDAAISQFLREFAGEDRTEGGFVSGLTEDGILQQSLYLAHRVGIARAEQVTGYEQNQAFTEQQRQALLRDSFSRLSADGHLRFETRLNEIRDRMLQGFKDGENPNTIARRLGKGLDGYEQGRLRAIVRTEAGIASESATRETYGAAGVRRVEVIGDSGTDEACASRIGRVFDIHDSDNLPIYHPNCFCSTVPADD